MNVNRLTKIAAVFAEEGLGYLTGYGAMRAVSGESTASKENSSNTDVEKARRLRRTFERLGPTFVKFGQMLANRVDLFSDDFISELSHLHASVAPFPDDVAVKIIEEELGEKIDITFFEFSAKPVASASIAQVYRAKLRISGEDVAIKVQRPNLDKNLLEDLELIVSMSSWLDSLVPSYRKSMMHVVAKEYATRSKTEMDFVNEANATQEFYDTYCEDKFVSFPKIHRDLCTDKIIVMEWIEGPMLGQIKSVQELKNKGFDPNELVRNLFRIQLTMAYENGLIHADMHPGNVILRSDGRLGLIDCGLHARIPKKTREIVLNMLLLQSQGRVEEQVDTALELSPPADQKDLAKFRQELIDHYSVPQAQSASSVSKDIIATMRIGARYRNYANPFLLMIVRNFLILEGIFLKFTPDFDPNELMGEYVKAILMRRFSPQAMLNTFTPMMGELAIALQNRPALLTRLIRLESKFIASKSVGDFLRSEDIIESPTKNSRPAWLHVFIGVLLGAMLVMVILLGIRS